MTHVGRAASDLLILNKVRRVAGTPAHRLRKVMFKKMLLKLISSFYSQLLKEPPKEEFSLFVYRLLVKKFIMIRAVNNRFEHLLSSCIKYKYIARVRLFSRFLGLYSPLQASELAFFINCLSMVANSSSGRFIQMSEDSETHLVVYPRCVEILKLTEKYFRGMTQVHERLQKLRTVDKASRQEVVHLDDFLEMLTETYQEQRSRALDFLKVIFEASDLNNDGFLQL